MAQNPPVHSLHVRLREFEALFAIVQGIALLIAAAFQLWFTPKTVMIAIAFGLVVLLFVVQMIMAWSGKPSWHLEGVIALAGAIAAGVILYLELLAPGWTYADINTPFWIVWIIDLIAAIFLVVRIHA